MKSKNCEDLQRQVYGQRSTIKRSNTREGFNMMNSLGNDEELDDD